MVFFVGAFRSDASGPCAVGVRLTFALVLAFVYASTGSLWMCVFLHAVNNAISFLAGYVTLYGGEVSLVLMNGYMIACIQCGRPVRLLARAAARVALLHRAVRRFRAPSAGGRTAVLRGAERVRGGVRAAVCVLYLSAILGDVVSYDEKWMRRAPVSQSRLLRRTSADRRGDRAGRRGGRHRPEYAREEAQRAAARGDRGPSTAPASASARGGWRAASFTSRWSRVRCAWARYQRAAGQRVFRGRSTPRPALAAAWSI